MRWFTLFFLSLNSIFFCQPKSLDHWIAILRDPQTERFAFRNALVHIGQGLALQVAERLPTKKTPITTLLGADAEYQKREQEPVLVTILRAGLPLNEGVLQTFPDSEVGFIAMARNEKTLVAKTSYLSLPQIKGKEVVISDTMLATGGSMIDALKEIEKQEPSKIYVICAIASRDGIARVKASHPLVEILPAVVDPMLDNKGYIVPGLGDAGDRSYGPKEVAYP